MIPDNIKKEHILRGIQQIDNEEFKPKYNSRGYDLFYNKKSYPPKYLIRLANKFADNIEELKFHGGKETNNFLKELGFEIREKDDNVEEVEFPEINKDLSIEELAKIYRDIEEGKEVKPLIDVPSNCNVIPSSKTGNCKFNLVGIIIDKRDFEKRIPEILAHLIRCKHMKVILAVAYWDGYAWETTWKKPFKAVGKEVYRQMYDGLPERII